MPEVLIIEEERICSDPLSNIIKGMGHEVTCTPTLKGGLKELNLRNFDVVFLDVQMPDGNGLDVLPEILEKSPSPEVIIITDFSTPEDAKAAIEKGAWCYIRKPFSINEINLLIVSILRYRQEREGKECSLILEEKRFKGIIASSFEMKLCKELAASVARIDTNVFIHGETGTGKELFARAIHDSSHRANKNFVIVDCTAIPEELVEGILFGHKKGSYTGAIESREGLIKQADGGTLFLDEVGELPLSIQKSFLRVIQEHRFRPVGYQQEIGSDFRLISASNSNLEDMARQNLFRDDLLFRLRSFNVELPPLRSHPQDVKELAIYYTAKLCKQYGSGKKKFYPGFFDALEAYYWPGNVRELIHALESSIVAAQGEPFLFPKHLPTYIRVWLTRTLVGKEVVTDEDTPSVTESSKAFLKLKDVREIALDKVEGKYLNDLMSFTKGDIKKACQLSGLSRTRLYVLLKKHKISTFA
jgi:two-component system NtrC family response regulator